MKMRIFISCLLFLFFSTASGQELITLTGKITNKTLAPLTGVSVYLLNTNRGAVTDDQGNFVIKNLLAGKYSIQISAIGYATTEMVINLAINTNTTPVIQLAEASRQLDAVVVSAQKREESLQKVPISITALSQRQVKEYRLWSTEELTALAPNLFTSNSGDDRNVTSIRGIFTSSYDQAVTTYIDGVNQFGLDTYIPQLLDIERIEILRGPQGTLYGRNAMGGVINVITKKPSNQKNGFAEVDFGNYGQQRYSAGIRTPLIKNKIDVGASLIYNKRNGFYKNEFNQGRFDNQAIFGGNYFLKMTAGEKWTMRLNAKHNNNKNDAAFPLVNRFAADPFNPAFVVNQNATAKMIDNTFNSSLTANYNGRYFAFSTQSAYQSNHRYYNRPLDGDFSPIDGVTIINDYGNKWNKVKVWTQELKFSSPAVSISSLNWTAGAYLFLQNNPTRQATRFGKDAALVGAPDTEFSLINTQKGKNSGAAFFGQLVYTIKEKFHIIAGLRYDYEKRKYQVVGAYQKDPDPLPQFETRPDTSATVTFNALSPKFGISYDINANSNLFAVYNRGFRAGGFTQLGADPSQPPLYSYKPEFSNSIEIGLKNNFFNNRLRINAALFYTTVTDAQVPTLVLPDAITVTRNAGRLASRGGELEITSTPVKGLQVEYNFGYTDAEFKTLKLSQNGAVVDLGGKKQIFTPETTSLLAVQYGYELKSKYLKKLVIRGEWMSLGKQYFDLSNSISQKAYCLFNTRFGVTTKFGELMFWGKNLGNKKYIAYAYDFGAVHLGNPKTFGVTLLTSF